MYCAHIKIMHKCISPVEAAAAAASVEEEHV